MPTAGIRRGAARRAWEEAKEKVAQILGAEPGEVIFTSGGTEANNLAVFGLAGMHQGPGHVVSSPIEHPAVAEAVARLEVEKFRVDRPPVNDEGLADAELMAAQFQRPDAAGDSDAREQRDGCHSAGTKACGAGTCAWRAGPYRRRAGRRAQFP